jgi:asparagine synthetase A
MRLRRHPVRVLARSGQGRSVSASRSAVTPAEFEHLFRLTKSRADAGDPASMNALGSLYAEMALLRKEPAMLEDAERAFRTAADWGHEPSDISRNGRSVQYWKKVVERRHSPKRRAQAQRELDKAVDGILENVVIQSSWIGTGAFYKLPFGWRPFEDPTCECTR